MRKTTVVGHQAGREAVLGLSEADKEAKQQREECRHLAPANRRGGDPQEERALEGLGHSVWDWGGCRKGCGIGVSSAGQCRQVADAVDGVGAQNPESPGIGA
jgi:hypothetical protein